MSIPDRPLLTVPQYRTLVRSLPRPTLSQMQHFALFVSNAHSWYKHLPYLPPGEPFQFFLDPGAGMQLSVSPQGSVDAMPRAERGHHYSWLPTAEYRDRFGFLAYSRSVGRSLSALSDDGSWLISSDVDSSVYDSTTRSLCPLPALVLEAGRAFISGVVYSSSMDCRRWQWILEAKRRVEWPEESGGSEAVARILDRCRVLGDDPSRIEHVDPDTIDWNHNSGLTSVDYPLYQLLEPERQRQRAGMVAAMTRVVELVSTSAG